jgi:exonuclease SbcD
MIKFIHTADVHFGVENYGKVDQETGLHSRFLDFVKSFEFCVDTAIKNDVDFFLFAGDAYKTAYPTPTQQKQFLRILFKLQQKKIPIIIVVGNHDHPLSFGKSHSLDVFSTVPLEGIHVFSKPDILNLKTKSGPVQIVGIPWPLRHNLISKDKHWIKTPQEISAYISEKVGMIIKDFADKLDEKIPSILTAHLSVSNGCFSGSERCAVFGSDPLFLPSQLAIKPFDYVALGHLHRHQVVNENSYPPIVYSGSIDRIDFGERKEKKGFCLVKLDSKSEKRRSSYEFVEIATRSMCQIDIKLSAGNQTKQLLKKIEECDINGAIIKIVYHLPDDVSDKVDLHAIQRACSNAHCIASITPVRKPAVHERRVPIKPSMDFASIVKKYLEFKDDIELDKKKLEEKALQLYEALYGENYEITPHKYANKEQGRVRHSQ